MKLKFFCLLMLSTLNCLAIQYDEEYEFSSQNYPSNTISNTLPWIKEICENKIYIKETSLGISTQGIFLDLTGTGTYLPLRELYTDLNGYFIDTYCDIPGIYGPCPSCGETTFLGNCGNPKCPSKN